MNSKYTNQLAFHSLKLYSGTSVKKIQILAFVEKISGGRQQVFESSIIDILPNKTNKVINESFGFELDRDECYLILEIKAFENNLWHKVCIYMFTDDLLKLKKDITVDFGEYQLKLYYDINTFIQKELEEIDPSINKINSEENDGMFEQLKVTRNFLRKIAPLRKLNNDITKFFSLKKLQRDLALFIAASLFIYFTLLSAFLCSVIIFIFGFKYKLRKRIAVFFNQYFTHNERPSVENSKNFYFLKNQQLMMINISDTLKRIFYERNRIALSQFFKKLFCSYIGICLLITYVNDIRLLIIMFLLFKLFKKYQQDIFQNFDNIVDLFYVEDKFINIVHYLSSFYNLTKRKKKIKLVKTCYTYENQRWFFQKGFLNKTLAFGEFIRETQFF